ncbi:OmpP1/FadL family transporter [Thaumasiovibrio subtropicus]|uniref:OmpP1/FadL family transporter n=1 Tax=Thaumasiovibrio subtropicus TaxID=1891207 RepID=UPI000B35FAC7|nr:outer membrane protein transport protein [Thaumasiovibrio subtropicus]
MSVKLKVATLAAAIASLHAHGAGFQVAEQSVSGIGRANAGEAAIADNAAVISRNPAAMTRFDTAQLSGGLMIVDTNIDVTDTDRNQTAHDVAPMAAVPATYYLKPINEKWWWGIAMFSQYGVATDYPDDFLHGDLAGNTSLITVNINPNIAFKVNDKLSLGFGLSLIYGDAELDRHLGGASGAFNGKPSDKLISMAGDTWAYGWNIGALYEVSDTTRFGLHYRAETELEFEGKFTDHQGIIIDGGVKGATVTGDLNVILPATFEFSGYHDLNETWAVHYSVFWTEWSKFTELKATNSKCNFNGLQNVCFFKEEKYDDAFRYAIGATYKHSDDWTFRAGLALDEQGGKPTLSIPDSDRFWYSVGATWQYSESLSFDAGLTYLTSDDISFKESGLLGETNFSSTGDAFVSGVQLNYTF